MGSTGDTDTTEASKYFAKAEANFALLMEIDELDQRVFSNPSIARERYRRPTFIAETGIESHARAGWLRYIGSEVGEALKLGIPVEGICLYPIVDFPGWGDDRHCETGLWGMADAHGHREIYRPLADELLIQQNELEQVRSKISINLEVAERFGLVTSAG